MSSDRIFVGLETSFSHDLPATLDKVYASASHVSIPIHLRC